MLQEKSLPIFSAGLRFKLQWNPHRELRLNHQLLLDRGVLVNTVETTELIHRNAAGHACYLCPHNIALQSPSETCLPIELNREPWVLGANFAPITNNHYTVMPHEHRPQRYHSGILQVGFELATATRGSFRALFNGRAGASILEHEHLHASDMVLPIELLAAESAAAIHQEHGVTVFRPDYPLPLWLLEGNDSGHIINLGHRLISAWKALDPQQHSVNLIMSLHDARYRLYILPRDLRLQTAPGRTAAMGSFETAGLIVLSNPDDRHWFDAADQASAWLLLAALTPEQSIHRAFLDAT